MRINKRLEQAASFNPTKKSHQMSIEDMCKKIETQEITLPLYQRDLSWTLEKCIALLNYQLLGKAPVSPISFNVINNLPNDIPQVSFLTREVVENIQRGQYSVVDGQQRLATNYKAYSNHEDFRNVVLDLGKGEFSVIKSSVRSNQIPVGILLNKEDSALFQYLGRHSNLNTPEVINLLLQIKTKIKGYNYTINSAENLTEDEQIQWFEVLNNAGSRVSIIQMRFSKLKAHGIDIYTHYTNIFRDKLYSCGYENFFVPQKTVVSYPIAALNPAYEKITSKPHSTNFAPIPSDTKENQLCDLSPEKLNQCFSITLEALDETLDFINENGLPPATRIDYINYLLGYFIFNPGTGEQKKSSLIDWYETTNFTNKSNTERREIYSQLLKLDDSY